MDKRAVEKAKVRLKGAEESLESLLNCKSFEDFDKTWYHFLMNAKAIIHIYNKVPKLRLNRSSGLNL